MKYILLFSVVVVAFLFHYFAFNAAFYLDVWIHRDEYKLAIFEARETGVKRFNKKDRQYIVGLTDGRNEEIFNIKDIFTNSVQGEVKIGDSCLVYLRGRSDGFLYFRKNNVVVSPDDFNFAVRNALLNLSGVFCCVCFGALFRFLWKRSLSQMRFH